MEKQRVAATMMEMILRRHERSPFDRHSLDYPFSTQTPGAQPPTPRGRRSPVALSRLFVPLDDGAEGFTVAVVHSNGTFHAGVVKSSGRKPRYPDRQRELGPTLMVETPTGLTVEGLRIDDAHLSARAFALWEKQYRQVVANRYQALRWSNQRTREPLVGLPEAATDGTGNMMVQGIDHRGAIVLGVPLREGPSWVDVPAGTRGVLADAELLVYYRTFKRSGSSRWGGYDTTRILYGHAYAVDPEELEGWRVVWDSPVNSDETPKHLPKAVTPDNLPQAEMAVALRPPAAVTYGLRGSYDIQVSKDTGLAGR